MSHDEVPKPHVLVVDDTPQNIDVLKSILVDDYTIKAAINGTIALSIAQTQRPDIILLDVMMPEMDGYEVCQKLKADPNTCDIPVIFVTALAETEQEERGLSLGAVDYLTKPVNPAIVRARVKTHLTLANQQRATREAVISRTKELAESQRSAIFMLGQAGHYNDTDTGAHIWRMAAYAAEIARRTGWSVEDAALLELAAPMHDTGKIGIPDEILKAPRQLTSEEMEIMKSHALIGRDILANSKTPLFQLAAEIALCHHEKWDGSGYPQGLKGEEIPESARIVAIADVFDALTMRRPYKESWSAEESKQHIQDQSGSHFDPNITALFIEHYDSLLAIKDSWNARESALSKT